MDGALRFRKATGDDLDAIERIYERTHDVEEAGLTTTGWVRGIYPVREVAEASLVRGDMYVAEVESFTHKNKNQVIVSKRFLHEGEHILIIDDFLANGCALQGLISIAESAGAIVEGCGIVIEKGFQFGGRVIRNMGYHVESLAIIEAMDAEAGTITFREQN